MQSAGGAMNQLGEFVGEAYLAAHRQLLDGVCDMVIIKFTYFQCPQRVLSAAPPASSQLPSHTGHDSVYSGDGGGETGLFGSICTVEEARHSLYTLTFPCRRNHGQGRSLLALSCATLGKP